MSLILPPRIADEREPTMVCRVPVGNDETCGKPFYPGEERAFQRHVGQCAREHIGEIVEESPRTKAPIFDEANWDPEVAAHMKKVGKTMREERRLEVKKSERAGF